MYIVFISVYTYIYIYTHMCICIYIYIYIYVYTYRIATTPRDGPDADARHGLPRPRHGAARRAQ